MDYVPLLVAVKGGLLSDDAVVASLAVAEVASLADFAGVASPVDLAGMAFSAVAWEMSPTEIAWMALPAVAGVVPRPNYLKRCSRPEPERSLWLLLRQHP